MAKEPNKTPEKDKGKPYVDWDTTGKVSKMMTNWGFDPAKGLGRNSNGILRPIEPTSSQKRMGLGYLDLATISPILQPPLLLRNSEFTGLGRNSNGIMRQVEPTSSQKRMGLGHLDLATISPILQPPFLPHLPTVQSIRKPAIVEEAKITVKRVSPEKDIWNSLATEQEILFQQEKMTKEYLKRNQKMIEEGRTEPLKEGKTAPSSSYEENIFPRNHTSVWGSFCIKHPEKHQWGYQCCKQVDKDCSCLCPPKNKRKIRRGRRGKNNNKTKVSSWQNPAEVKVLGKKPEERAMESLASVPSADLTEKGSDQLSLSAPAVSNGGRDAASLKPTNFGSSALKLVKQKLHDSGVPVSSTSTSVEANGCKAIEVTPSGESGDGTGKVKDAPGAGDLSDSSSDSEDEDSGLSKEEFFKQFKPDKVAAQPIPVSMENLPGTDWALVSTNDGKKYYYNNKTKVSSWQIPAEVKDLGKKPEERAMESLASVPSADLTEKGSDQLSLSAPAISNGSRDAASLKTTNFGSSALKLVKQKLHDSGVPVSSTTTTEATGGKAIEVTPSGESGNGTGKVKDAPGAGDLSDSSSDSEDEDSGPSKEECFKQFKEMLKERGIAPFSKWEKELPKIIFDPRFKAIPSHSVRRSLFEQYVKTRAEEERREKRAAHKAAIEGFRQLLDEASTDIDQHTDYRAFKKKWGNDLRFKALERKEREALLNDRVLSLKWTAEQKAQEIRAAAASDFKIMLREREVPINSHWSKVKDSLRNEPRYRSVVHEDREVFYNEYIAELKAAKRGDDHEMKARDKEDKLRQRERELRKRREREVQEVERVRQKIRRKEASSSYQALLVEKIRDPEASWTESKPKLERDPQKRSSNPDLDPADKEKLFRDHLKTLYKRCVQDFKALLVEALSSETTSQQTEDGKTVLNSWSTAKQVLKSDIRYSKMPRKDREVLWRRYAEDISRKQKQENYQDEKQRDYKTQKTVDQ